MVLLKLTSTKREKSHDFTIDIGNLVLQGNHNDAYEMALVNANIWYSFYNISTTYNNNVFKYIIDNTANYPTEETVTIPDGLYSIETIIKIIGNGMVSNGHDKENIIIVANYNTGKIEITLSNAHSVVFHQGDNLFEILGFESSTYVSGDGKHISAHHGDITRGVSDISINCSLVNSSYSNGVSSDVLYSFVPDKSPQSLLVVSPNERVYSTINQHGGDTISKIRMYITDNLNRAIDLNKEPTSYLVHIRRVTK